MTWRAVSYRPQTDHKQTTPGRYWTGRSGTSARTETAADLQKRRSGRMWITLVRMVRDAEVGSSNLPHPTQRNCRSARVSGPR